MLWIWLEFIGINVLDYLRDCNNNSLILKFAEEAEHILTWLRPGGQLPTEEFHAIPKISSLVTSGEFFNLRFFIFNHQVVLRGLELISNGVGRFIFDDHLHSLLANYESQRRAMEEEGVPGLPTLPLELAEGYEPPIMMAEDRRTMFISFSSGQPMSREGLIRDFQLRAGDVVEVERMVTPLFARVVFGDGAALADILNRQQTLKLEVNGKAVWARKYCPTTS